MNATTKTKLIKILRIGNSCSAQRLSASLGESPGKGHQKRALPAPPSGHVLPLMPRPAARVNRIRDSVVVSFEKLSKIRQMTPAPEIPLARA
jgi:hypothetical protein